ncbi:hypothetical protein niasHT_039011 [Heterodera trifolii]|uniref:Glycine-rich protein n=1 Tax=Heterodera trifolii TaxID=157864 RepID=A0ABD2J4F9_9BILA
MLANHRQIFLHFLFAIAIFVFVIVPLMADSEHEIHADQQSAINPREKRWGGGWGRPWGWGGGWRRPWGGWGWGR